MDKLFKAICIYLYIYTHTQFHRALSSINSVNKGLKRSANLPELECTLGNTVPMMSSSVIGDSNCEFEEQLNTSGAEWDLENSGNDLRFSKCRRRR